MPGDDDVLCVTSHTFICHILNMSHNMWPTDDDVSHYQCVTPMAQGMMGCTINMSHNLTTYHTGTGRFNFVRLNILK